ncbi:MAG: hypothetical protein ACRDGM_18000 [bacterium]
MGDPLVELITFARVGDKIIADQFPEWIRADHDFLDRVAPKHFGWVWKDDVRYLEINADNGHALYKEEWQVPYIARTTRTLNRDPFEGSSLLSLVSSNMDTSDD